MCECVCVGGGVSVCVYRCVLLSVCVCVHVFVCMHGCV